MYANRQQIFRSGDNSISAFFQPSSLPIGNCANHVQKCNISRIRKVTGWPVVVVVFWSRKSATIGLVSVSARARQILVEIFIAYNRFYTILFTPPITEVNI